MTRTPWFRSLFSSVRPNRRERRRHTSQRRRRPVVDTTTATVESLEDRVLLTTYTVDTLHDTVAYDGKLSLREAILAANTNSPVNEAAAGMANGDVINFANSLSGGTIYLNGSQLTVTDDVSINAVSILGITIDGGNNSRIFDISNGASETTALRWITMQNGRATTGGAVQFSGGTLQITDSIVTDSTATVKGGGLFNNGGTVVIRDTPFTFNEALGFGGGAMYNAGGDISILRSRISENFARNNVGRGGGLLSVGGNVQIHNTTFTWNFAKGAGGGVAVDGGKLTLNNSELTSNFAGGSVVGTGTPANGGGLYITGGAMGTAFNTLISENEADMSGGGVWIGNNTSLLIRQGTVTDNKAHGDAVGKGGGGLFNDGGDLDVVGATTISGNMATGVSGSGGGMMSTGGSVFVRDSFVTGNMANRYGGGIAATGGSLKVVWSEVDDNVAGPAGSANPGDGGGIYFTGSTLNVRHTKLRNNIAARSGGAIWKGGGASLTLYKSTLTGNMANGNNAMDGGGGVYNASGPVTILRSTISNNKAKGTYGSGGGLFTKSGNVSIFNTTIANNSASRAGGGIETVDGWLLLAKSTLNGNVTGWYPNNNPGNGGGLHVTGNSTDVTIRDSWVTNNSAANEGGGLWNQAGSTMTVLRTDISDNTASGHAVHDGGGGIFNNGGNLDVRFSSIVNNQANGSQGSGGGIHNTAGGDVFLENVYVQNNSATLFGGGIYNAGHATIWNSTITYNSAWNNGGGIYIAYGGVTALNNTQVAYNSPNNIAGPGTLH